VVNNGIAILSISTRALRLCFGYMPMKWLAGGVNLAAW